MTQDWRPVGDEITLSYGKPLPAELRSPGGKYSVFGANGEKDRADRALVNRPGIIIGRKGSAGEVTLSEAPFWPLDVTYYVSFDERRHELRYVYYLLTSL